MLRNFLLVTALACACAGPAHARGSTALPTAVLPSKVPASGVIGVDEAYLSPEFWVRRQRDANRVVLDRRAIDAQNNKLMRIDDSMHDLRAIPTTLSGQQVADWIKHMSHRPGKALFDVNGVPVPAATLDAIVDGINLDAIPEQQSTRYGLVVRRAALRTFPTDLRVFSEQGDTDIDRFQESALFPGTPVVIAHASRDGRWLFVVSPRYAAWVEKPFIAEGSKEEVLGYADKAPYRIVTGANVLTVFTPEQPQVSQLQLDMGVRVPLAGLPADQPVNGQHPYTSWTLQLPIREQDGKLSFAPALLQKIADSTAQPLPLTRANIIRQAFKFLGERYGWGHDYNARDCSGFVSETYHSMGVLLPRNTSDQAVSPALDRIHFDPTDGRAKRMAEVDGLQVGDLIYIPGHVMMMIGRIGNVPYVIHDTAGGSYLDAGGKMHSMDLNAVSMTPLTPLRFSATQSYIDRITNIVRIRPTDHSSTARP